MVLAADHCPNRKPALEEQTGHGSADRPELAGCAGDKYRCAFCHVTSHVFADAARDIRNASATFSEDALLQEW